MVCLGGSVGSVNILGGELIGWWFGICAELKVVEVRVLNDPVDDVIIVVGWRGFDKSFTNALGYVDCVLGVM